MLCQKCQSIPLDLFLPVKGFKSQGYMYDQEHTHYEGIDGGPSALEQLDTSIKAGCKVCRMFKQALVGEEACREVEVFPSRTDYKYNSLVEKIENAPYGTVTSIRLRACRQSAKDYEPEGGLLVYDGPRYGRLLWGWTTPDRTVGYHRPGRILQYPNATEASKLCRQWLDKCMRDHPKCQPERSGNPPRLVDIYNLRLIDAEQLPPLQYACLSYVRAAEEKLVGTSGANLYHRMHGILDDDLSSTVQEALRITRGLGLQYIWIEKLCIVQDSTADWNRHCKAMDSIFKEAAVVLSLTDGTFYNTRDESFVNGATLPAKNSGTGNVNKNGLRGPGPPSSADVTLQMELKPWKTALNGVLSTQAETLQEHECATRMIHFTRSRIFWECRTCNASEDEPEMKDKYHHGGDIPFQYTHLRLLELKNKYGLDRIWADFVVDFTSRELHSPQNKLAAMAGFVKAYNKTGYLAGLWRDTLITDLTWFPGSKRRPVKGWPPQARDPSIPSWSWASYDGPVGSVSQRDQWHKTSWQNVTDAQGQSKYMKVKNIPVSVVEANTTPIIDDIFGPVAGGRLVLRGNVIRVLVTEQHFVPLFCSVAWEKKCYSVPLTGANSYGRVTLYFDYDPEHVDHSKLLCFQIGTGAPLRPAPKDTICGLVLAPTANNTYRRVGMFDIETDDNYWKECHENVTVTIT